MNKKIQEILQSKYFYLVISALAAVAIWIIALNTSNPVIENTVEVSVIYLNETAPAEKNLSRTSELGLTTATVKVSGRQNTINKLLPSELKVYIDFADVKEIGVAHLKLSKPECDRVGVKIVDYYPKEIDVSYDTKIEKYLNIETEYTNEILAEKFEFLYVKTEPESIPISGFATEIGDLDYIKVSLSDNIQNGTIDSSRTISLLGRYITTSGHDVTADFNPEKITVKIDVAKRIPIKYTISGTPANDYYTVKDEISFGTVLLRGDSGDISGINELNLGSINIDGISSDFREEIDLTKYIPTGVSIYGDTMRVVTVDIDKYVTKSIELGIDDISLPGRNNSEYDYTINFSENMNVVDGKILITVKGKAKAVGDLSVSLLKPVLDLSDKQVGLYRMDILFTEPEDVDILDVYTVNVDVKYAEYDEDQDNIPDDTAPPNNTPSPDVTPSPDEGQEEGPENENVVENGTLSENVLN